MRDARDIRLIPAVLGVGAILFLLKAGGLVFGASAATPAAPAPAAPAAAAPAKPAAPAPGTTAGATDPLAAIKAALPLPPGKQTATDEPQQKAPDDLPPELAGAGVSSAEMDVLTSLADRRDALEQRQRELDLRANIIAATEKRVDGKISDLKAIQAKIEALLGQRDQLDTAQLDGLVKIYTAMKPVAAAKVFATLDDQVRLGVAGRMKTDAMAAIFAALPPDVAQKLTVEMAGRYKLPTDTAAQVSTAVPPAPSPAAPAPTASAAPPVPPGG